MKLPEASPEGLIGLLSAYQRSAVLKAALELDLFSAIGEGAESVESLSVRCRSSPRGIRALADYLVVLGVLRKRDQRYTLTKESAAFLDIASDRYIGRVDEFVMHPQLLEYFQDTATAIRLGGRPASRGSFAEDHPAWLAYAQAMGPVMAPVATALAEVLDDEALASILDVGAGHGMFGIKLALRNREAEVVATDWPGVLHIAERNALAAGIARRFHVLPGDLRTIVFSGTYNLAILANILHQFDPDVCVDLLKRVRDALKQNGRVVAVEFVPNEDRVSPPAVTMMEMTMLVSTPAGRTYTFAELDAMLRSAGFGRSSTLTLPATHLRAIIGHLQ